MAEVKSRTFTLSDEDWDAILKASMDMGLGKYGRGRAIVMLAKKYNKNRAAAKARAQSK